MSHSRRFSPAIFVTAAITAMPASAAALTEVWRAPGFDLPESVSYDAGSNAFYVSNLGTDPMSKDGNGFIAKLTADGKVDKLKWVEGLNAPKGTEIVGDSLFVADLDELVEIDIANGEIKARHPVPGARFLNDIAAAVDGRIFISDTMNNAIYLFQDGKAEEWVKDPRLIGPNGLTIIETNLVVADLGDLMLGDKIKPMNIKKIDLATKEIDDFGTAEPIGNLDGLEKMADGSVAVTDNFAGKLFSVKPGEKAVEIGKFAAGTADFEFVPMQSLIVIPIMSENAVVAFRIAD